MSIPRIIALAAGGLILSATAGQLSPLHAQANASLTADADVIREGTARNLLEVRLGQLAAKQTTQPDVRAFSDRMITDHNNMFQQWSGVYQQWTAAVGQHGKIEPGLGPTQAAELARLQKVAKADFDREYMSTMIRHHQDNLSYFQNAANSARSTQVRELILNGLPVLQQHLTQAIQVGSRVGVTPTVATNVPGTSPTSGSPAQAPAAQAPTAPGQNPTAPAPTSPTAGQSPTTTANPPVTTQNAPVGREDLSKDSKFIREAVADNTLEIRLAQVAQQKSTNPSVRQLAQQVINDHTALQNRWITMAASNGMNLRPGMGRRHMAKVTRLEKTPNAEFDRAYLTMLIQNNQDYLEYFQKEGRATTSSQVRNLAASELTTLQQHSSQAKRLGTQSGVDTTAVLHARTQSAYRNQ